MKIESPEPVFRPLTVTIETPDEAKAIKGALGKMTGGQYVTHCGFSWDEDPGRGRAVCDAMHALYAACKDATE